MASAKKKYWFKAKKYGYGWVPASIKGWVVMVIYVVLTIILAIRIDKNSHSGSDTLIAFVPAFFILTAILILISHIKGEPSRWNWNKRKE